MLRDGLFGLGHEPGEELQGTDLEGDGVRVVDRGVLGGFARTPRRYSASADEGAGVALLGEPLDAGEVRRVFLAQALEPALELAGLVGRAVDRATPPYLSTTSSRLLTNGLSGLPRNSLTAWTSAAWMRSRARMSSRSAMRLAVYAAGPTLLVGRAQRLAQATPSSSLAAATASIASSA